MSLTLTGYLAKHGGGLYDPNRSRLIGDYQPRHAVLCYRCATDPVDTFEPDPTYCTGCLDEIAHAAETRRYESAAGDHSTTWGAL